MKAPRPPPRERSVPSQTPGRPMPREMRFPVAQSNRPLPLDTLVSGRCWVIDGDTIVIDKMHIRLAGIDAPELDHPWGQQSKWAMVKLCSGQTITARIKPELSYDRVVAECFLPDGRDLAAELVKAGLALDWPKFSGGKYRPLEPADVRKKLWRANLRQSGMMWPRDERAPAATRPVGMSPERRHDLLPLPAARHVPPPRANYRIGWLVACGVLVSLAGCNFIGGGADQSVPARPVRQPAALASFEVTASVLNVRKAPSANARVIGQIGKGTTVSPKHLSDAWYGIEMADGSIGWVHRDFLRPAEE